jgi:hypothetical protein
VKEELRGNRFVIAGAGSGQRVCRQVTGRRKDAWAIANPLIVERDKRRVEEGHLRRVRAIDNARSNGDVIASSLRSQ